MHHRRRRPALSKYSTGGRELFAAPLLLLLPKAVAEMSEEQVSEVLPLQASTFKVTSKELAVNQGAGVNGNEIQYVRGRRCARRMF